MNQTVLADLVTLHYRIALPNGQPLLCTFDATSALIDLNHPLAGKPVHLEVEIIGAASA